MHLVRASARRFSSNVTGGFNKSVRSAQPQLQRQWLRHGQRNYASAAETVKQKASSDMPWLITALAVTVPGVYYVLRPSADADHGGHDEHGDHASEHHGDESDKSEEDNATDDQSEDAPKAEKKDSEGDDGDSADEKSSSQDANDEDTSKSGSDSGKSRATKVDGVNFAGGTLKHESDAKGGVKKRIDSDLAKNIGEGSSSGEGDDMSHKQRGYSNTDTRHSIDISKDGSGKSKKGEGTAETAKIKGTVDGNRPQV